jgi:hypothetical protein
MVSVDDCSGSNLIKDTVHYEPLPIDGSRAVSTNLDGRYAEGVFGLACDGTPKGRLIKVVSIPPVLYEFFNDLDWPTCSVLVC